MTNKPLLLEVPQQFFAEWAVRQIRQGFGLVPFVGSGLSAPSGILTGNDFTNYITWTLYKCVSGIEDPSAACYDLQRDGWPEPPDQQKIEQAKKWVWDHFLAYSDAAGIKINGKTREQNQDAKPQERSVNDIKVKSGADAIQCELLRPLVPDIIATGASYAADQRTKALLRSVGREQALRQTLPRHGQFATTRSFILEAAIRSLYEWRAALDFLARLRVDRTHHDLPLRLDDQTDQSVIDRFNISITYGRRPNLAHNMLCHLAGRARIHTVLTTNFDKLIEEAFATLGQPLDVIPVSLRGELPAPGTVLAQPSVVKLHGDSLETRADHSLDDAPSHEDLRRFFEYVTGRPPGVPPEDGHLPSILIVCGYSGSDMRCMQMIRYVLEADETSRVLWVCHGEKDITKIKDAFKGYEHRKQDRSFLPGDPDWNDPDQKSRPGRRARRRRGTPGIPGSSNPGLKPEPGREEAEGVWRDARVIATVTNRCDLLLYEIYQRLTLSLPRGGFNYQFSPNIPPGLNDPAPQPAPPKNDAEYKEQREVAEAQEDLRRSLFAALEEESFKDGEHPPKRRMLCVDGASGVMPPLRKVYRQVTEEHRRRRQGIWLWLGDHANTNSLVHELLTVLALRAGRFQLDHAVFGCPDDVAAPGDDRETQLEKLLAYWQAQLKKLLTHWMIDPDDWFIVIEGRNGVGSCADSSGQTVWKAAEYDVFTQFLRALHEVRNDRAGKRGFHVVYAPFSTERKAHIDAREKVVAEFIGTIRQDATKADVPMDQLSFREEMRRVWEKSQREWKKSQQAGNFTVPSGRAAPAADRTMDWGEAHVLDPKAGWQVFTLKKSSTSVFRSLLEGIYEKTLKDPARDPRRSDSEWHEAAAKRRAIYGAMLFRASRHFSAFMSEGVYPCPCRYNDKEQDNDWTRYQHIYQWLREWKNLSAGGLFMGKAGGFEWMYRDARLGILRLIEAVEPIPFDSRKSYLQNAWEGKARMHYWIGDWYMRAHRATGHAEPLLEAIFHFGSCIHSSPYARPTAKLDSPIPPYNFPAYRQRYARRAMLEMIKALRMGRREINFWIQPPAGDAWFKVDEATGHWKVANAFREIFKHLGEKEAVWESWIAQFEAELAQLPQLAGAKRLVFQRVTALPKGEAGAPSNEDTFVTARPCFAESLDPLKDPKEWWAEMMVWIDQKFSPPGAATKLRDYLRTICGRCKMHMDDTTAASADQQAVNDHFNRKLKSEMLGVSNAVRHDPRLLYILVQVLSEIAYGVVQCAKRQERIHEGNDSRERHLQIRRLWIEVCALCWATFDLCVELPPPLHEEDCRMRIKTSTIYGIALGRLGRFFEAHRRLNESYGWLSKSETRHDPLESAIIEVRRAELHLLEAARLKKILCAMDQIREREAGWKSIQAALKTMRGTPDVAALDKYLHEWEAALPPDPIGSGMEFKFSAFLAAQQIAPETIKQWRHIYLGAADAIGPRAAQDFQSVRRELLRIHVAKLDDAWMTLGAAERLHSGTTHSTLWWGHLYILKLRLYADHWWPGSQTDERIPDLFRARIFGQRRDHRATVRQLYYAARVATHMDPYRRLRIIQYTIRAFSCALRHLRQSQMIGSSSLQSDFDFVRELGNELKQVGEDLNKTLSSGILLPYLSIISEELKNFAP